MDIDPDKNTIYDIDIKDLLSGGLDVTPIDLTRSLPRHASKRYKTRKESQIDMVVVHCTDRDWSVEQVAEYDTSGSLTYTREIDDQEITDVNHINAKGIPGITYNECVGADQVWYTLPYNEVSYHAGGYNTRSVAIAMLYRTTNPETNRAEYSPPQRMVKLTQCRAAELCLKFGLAPDRIFGHRELQGTGWDFIRGRKRLLKTCPGPYVNMTNIRRNVAVYMQVHLQLKGFYSGKIDGSFGKRSKAALSAYKLL